MYILLHDKRTTKYRTYYRLFIVLAVTVIGGNMKRNPDPTKVIEQQIMRHSVMSRVGRVHTHILVTCFELYQTYNVID